MRTNGSKATFFWHPLIFAMMCMSVVVVIFFVVYFERTKNFPDSAWVQAGAAAISLFIVIGLAFWQDHQLRVRDFDERKRIVDAAFAPTIALAEVLIYEVTCGAIYLEDPSAARERFGETGQPPVLDELLKDLNSQSIGALGSIDAFRAALLVRQSCLSMVRWYQVIAGEFMASRARGDENMYPGRARLEAQQGCTEARGAIDKLIIERDRLVV
ncbi:hypothetical protein [Methylibium sp. Pch-M]|uniref:hypothetical protein n=1 Tax=Methylibium sp. Pch-M TaxID=2082386 RepID=UPI00101023B1|nr:hypothetical protein [Methylibium sp. Pch-M]